MPAEADAMQSRDMFEEPLINDVKDEDVDAEFGGREISDRGDTAPLGVGINMVKCAVGAGSFSFPYAFTQTGIWEVLSASARLRSSPVSPWQSSPVPKSFF